MNEQEALRKEMLDRHIELIFEEMERNHPEFSQEEAELSRIRDEIEQDPLLGPAGKEQMQEYIRFLSRMEQRHNNRMPATKKWLLLCGPLHQSRRQTKSQMGIHQTSRSRSQ